MQGVVSFEWALALAQQDLLDGRVTMALIGGVDENCFPRRDYLRRWPLRDTQRMGEGSAWWLVSEVVQGARAELLPVTRLATAGLGAAAWAEALRASGRVDGTVIPSAQLTDEESAVLIRSYRTESFAAYTGAYPTAAALALTLWLEWAPARAASAVHVSRVPDGDTMLTALRVLG
jgi:hypothetical protein